jgi:NADPH:quinone reductase
LASVLKSTIIDAPIDEVWTVLRDFNGHDRWHPAIATSRIEDGVAVDMVGAVRDFKLQDGSRIREQLLALSDEDHEFTYCILQAPIPLYGYVARVRLKPVTDGRQTFWEWRSTFEPPAHRKGELVKLVGEGIYEAGFRAIKGLLRHRRVPPQPAAPQARVQSPAASVLDNVAQMQANAVIMARYGGPEVLELRDVSVGPPGYGEVRIRQTAIGVNYIDVYCRTGYFDLVKLPGIPGMEAAGVIESVGTGVAGLSVGDRVGYACAPPGSYVALRVMPWDRLVRLPETIDDQKAAGCLLKGITAGFLLHDVYEVKAGDTVLVHAASGGVGRLLCQWASALGATVIGTASSQAKARLAAAAGCSYVLEYAQGGFTDEVLALTNGRGVDVVYDAVGRDTFEGSLNSLKPRGHLVSFGQASGDIGPYEIGRLAAKSATISRPNYGHYTETGEDIQRHAARLFRAVSEGLVHIEAPTLYRLAEAGRAHADLEARQTTGSLVLVP